MRPRFLAVVPFGLWSPPSPRALPSALSGCNENDTDHLDRDQQAYAPTQKTKRMRTSFKHHQLRTMKSYFAINHNPDAKDLKQLAQKTGLTKRVLQVSGEPFFLLIPDHLISVSAPHSSSMSLSFHTSIIIEVIITSLILFVWLVHVVIRCISRGFDLRFCRFLNVISWQREERSRLKRRNCSWLLTNESARVLFSYLKNSKRSGLMFWSAIKVHIRIFSVQELTGSLLSAP